LGLAKKKKMKHLKQLKKRLSVLEEEAPEAFQRLKTKIL